MTSRAVIFAVVVMVLWPAWVMGQSSPEPSSADPGDAVFQLEVFDRLSSSGGMMRAYEYGTGFFIAGDGTALTASHVVYRAVLAPEKFRLLAIVGKEFYDADVVCASKLPYDPTKNDPNQIGVSPARDLAEVKLAPSTIPEAYRRLAINANGVEVTIATAHTDPLPTFPFLTIGSHPGVHVRIMGFGGISPIPYKWTSDGQVVQSYAASDGTPVFDIVSHNPAVPGDSGAPVLDDHNQVVGLYAWQAYNPPDTGTAMEGSVLKTPCR